MKAILFDIDGVLLRHDTWFIEEFCKGYGEEAFSVMLEYCNGDEIAKCDKGYADSYSEILPFLKRIGYKGTVEEFFELKNEFESRGIDYFALNKIKQINNEKIKCFIGSNQDKRRKQFLIKALKLDEVVTESYFSCDFNYMKPEKEYWEIAHWKMEKYLGKIEPYNILFFDDRVENIHSASDYGFSVVHVKNKDDLYIRLNEIMS